MTVDPAAQKRQQIELAKQDTYKACYDETCQIDLGKALAASHILRVRIAKFGAKCVLNAELIDLRTEVTMRAGVGEADCSAEGFLEMSHSVSAIIAP